MQPTDAKIARLVTFDQAVAMTAPFALPTAYRDMFREHGGSTVRVDSADGCTFTVVLSNGQRWFVGSRFVEYPTSRH